MIVTIKPFYFITLSQIILNFFPIKISMQLSSPSPISGEEGQGKARQPEVYAAVGTYLVTGAICRYKKRGTEIGKVKGGLVLAM